MATTIRHPVGRRNGISGRLARRPWTSRDDFGKIPAQDQLRQGRRRRAKWPTTTSKTALDRAGLTAEQFAEIVSVDPRTVERWVAGRTPYRRRRVAISRALDIPEHDLWPDLTPEPEEPGEPDQATSPTGTSAASDETEDESPSPTSEVVATWGKTNAPGTPTASAFLSTARERVDLLIAASGLIDNTPGLLDQLTKLADAGVQVRVQDNEPTPELGGLAAHDNVEVRTQDLRITHAMLRCDDTMLLILRLAGTSVPPLMQLTRRCDAGLFDRLQEHFHGCWDTSEPVAASTTPTRKWPGQSA